MPLQEIEVVRMLVMHGAWEQVEGDKGKSRWCISIDGITSSTRRKELLSAFQNLCPSATAQIIDRPSERVWSLTVDPLEIKDARHHFKRQRDAAGLFVGRMRESGRDR